MLSLPRQPQHVALQRQSSSLLEHRCFHTIRPGRAANFCRVTALAGLLFCTNGLANVEVPPLGKPLELHIGDTTVGFPLALEHAQKLQSSVQQLLQTFAEKQKQERPKRYKPMEFRFQGKPHVENANTLRYQNEHSVKKSIVALHEGAGEDELKLLELFCNPNASTNAFTARVLVSLQTQNGVRITTEGPLTNIKADIDTHLEQIAK